MVAHEIVGAPALTDLLLAVSRAEFSEELHQSTCRALRADSECASCLAYEAVWLAADRALTAFLAEVAS